MKLGTHGLVMAGLLFGAMPSSSSYGLHNYGFGSGGTNNASSSNYKLNGISGEASNGQTTSTSYKVRSGNINSQQANVPPAPTFSNPSNYYDKLHFVIATGSNPSDARYAIAISSDNFATTKYVQSDDTIGSSYSITNYQTYSAWGGASGQNIIGLTPNTTYKIKVAAWQGTFTGTEFGPTASAATVTQSITFSIHTDSQANAPFSTAFGNLLPGTVTTATNKVWVALTTNADAGSTVYINSANAGLHSAHASTTIASASADLSSASSGYGAQGTSVTQTSGGPFGILSPFNNAAQQVGILNTYLTSIFSSSTPITGASGSLTLMAKAASITPESSDYQDTLTLTAAGSF